MTSIQELSNQIINIAKEIQTATGDHTDKLQQLETEVKNLKEQNQRLSKEKNELDEKYTEAQQKVDKIEKQLANTVSSLEELSKEKDKKVDTLKLLDVYLVLMEQVFETKPHVRLLLMLHGDKEEFAISDLVSASGITALQVKQALFELRNTGVVEINEDKDTVKLKMRFLD